MRVAQKPENEAAGGRLVATDGRVLPLKDMKLTADARCGIARVRVEQRFLNPYDEPLEVTYQLPLPEDAAVSGFAFSIAGRRVVGEVDRRASARERYEQALLEGRTAALLDQDRASLFTQSLGNVPPKTDVVAELAVDQRLRWLDEGAWEWRFPTTVAPRYLGADGRVPDKDRIAVDVADGPLDARLHVALRVRDRLPAGAAVEGGSHRIACADVADGLEAKLADAAGAPLDRDLVLRWSAAGARVGVALDSCVIARKGGGPKRFGLLTVTPPRPDAPAQPLARDLIVLLDTSGSMRGEPLAQARRVAGALVDSLTDADHLEIIAFANEPRRWKRGPVAATADLRREAHAWLAALEASGGTEMRSGIFEALAPLSRDAQRQVVLVTDGEIGFEREVITTILERLPRQSRLHTVGVGSAVNRSLTEPAARAGRGVEVIVDVGEDAERAAARVLARTRAPLVTNVEVVGSAVAEVVPSRLPDLFAGAPLLVGVALAPEGGSLRVRGTTASGPWEQNLEVSTASAVEGSPAIAALWAREKVEDLEMALAAGGARSLEDEVERLGIDFQIATRVTSWVAVSEEPTVDPRKPTRKVKMPHALPQGMSAEGLGLAPAFAPAEEFSFASVRYCARDLAVPSDEVRDLFSIEPSAPAPWRDAPSGPMPAIRLRGKVRSAAAGRFVIEVEIDRELAWEPDALITIVWADGTETGAKLDEAATSAPGLIAAGQVARLVMKTRPNSKRAASLRFDCAGAQVTVALEP